MMKATLRNCGIITSAESERSIARETTAAPPDAAGSAAASVAVELSLAAEESAKVTEDTER